MAKATDTETQPLNAAVLTVSDTRTEADDTSGDFLASALLEAGHTVGDRAIVIDDIYQIRAVLSRWIADANVDAVLVTGGTGFSGRDSTPEAVSPLFDKQIEGFGEVFRALSFDEIGSSTVQSRALAGFANNTVIEPQNYIARILEENTSLGPGHHGYWVNNRDAACKGC